MKIGILTYHRSHNYGALLQAIALRESIEELGHDAYFVDYWPDYHRRMYALFDKHKLNWKSPLKTLLYLSSFILFFPYKRKRNLKFREFINTYIKPYCKDTTYYFDIIVCGSDQIWRKQPGLNYILNPVYFASGDLYAKNYISYAASMGNIDITEQDKEKIESWLHRFSRISVREVSLKNLLNRIGVKNVEVVADPTLLMLQNKWRYIIREAYQKKRKKYLLYYTLQKDSFDFSSVKNYAKKNNLKFVKLRAFAGLDSYSSNTITCANPFEMIDIIANAEIIFTSSYHGLVFSIIFERQFVASFSTNRERAKSLLDTLNLQDRLVAAQAKNFPNSIINYEKIEPLLTNFRKHSLEWLSNTLTLMVQH